MKILDGLANSFYLNAKQIYTFLKNDQNEYVSLIAMWLSGCWIIKN